MADNSPEVADLKNDVDYLSLVEQLRGFSLQEVAASLAKQLTSIWLQAYVAMTARPVDVCIISSRTFEYLFDHYSIIEAELMLPPDPTQEDRLVAACGHSNPQPRSRDDYRLKGWPGRSEADFGKLWDRGHFMGHAIGGAIDQSELNVFVQRRDLNRGWSRAGKLYRQMEKYCSLNPGTFCFSRPLYSDGTAHPIILEFGVLKQDGTLWVELFNNDYRERTVNGKAIN